MKTIINSITGEVLYCTLIEVDLQENQTLIDGIPTGKFYNFETMEYYD